LPKLLLAAGGTGGHMFPAQALAEILKAKGWDIAMMTDARGRKHSGNIPADPIIEVKAASISPRKPIAAIKGVLSLRQGVKEARKFIKEWKPDIVVGFGGYPAYPAMRAAQALKIPTVLHEQNAVLGRVNRLFAKKAKCVVAGFQILEHLPKGAKVEVLGNPLREQIINAVPESYTPPEPNGDINVLIVGGSLGARIISVVMPQAISILPEELRTRIKVVQQTRAENLEQARRVYETAGVSAICETFFSDIETHLAKAHYVIGRAGASSVSEIAVMGKPSLLVPLAIAMDDHQTVNAESLTRLFAADVLPESRFTHLNVKTLLEKRLSDSIWLTKAAEVARKAGKPLAATDLAALVSAIAFKR